MKSNNIAKNNVLLCMIPWTDTNYLHLIIIEE